jgi:F420-dependent oxidoreductase-like protein
MTTAGADRLLFAYHMPSLTFPDTPPERLFERILGNAQAAEAAGFDLVTVMDHLYQIPPVGPAEQPMLEGYATLAAIAARTSRVRLATMVTGVTYRNPALVAKMVTSLDVISGGRAVCGLGAAWFEAEHDGYGFDFPPIGERLDRLEEAIQICRLMFTEERPTFAGRHYRIERALNSPRPIQPGGPPILIGGSGERRTLRLVAKYADIANWFGLPDELRHKTEVLERHCEEVGRDPAEILRTVLLTVVLVSDPADVGPTLDRLPPERRAQAVVGTPQEAAERLQPYLDLGIRGFVFRNPTLMTPEAIALAGELIGQLRRQTVVA